MRELYYGVGICVEVTVADEMTDSSNVHESSRYLTRAHGVYIQMRRFVIQKGEGGGGIPAH